MVIYKINGGYQVVSIKYLVISVFLKAKISKKGVLTWALK